MSTNHMTYAEIAAELAAEREAHMAMKEAYAQTSALVDALRERFGGDWDHILLRAAEIRRARIAYPKP